MNIQFTTYWLPLANKECDGILLLKKCSNQLNYAFSSLDYKIFSHVITFHVWINRDVSQITFYDMTVKLLDLNTI